MTSTTRGSMTPRERVLAAAKGLSVDRVPVMYWLNPHMACRLLAEYRPGGDRTTSALARLLWRRYVRGGGLNAGELTRAMPLLFEQYGNGPYALELGADLAIQSPDLTSAGSFLSGVRRRGGRLRIRGPLGITYGIGGIYAEVVDHPIEGPEDLRTFALPPVTAEQFAGIARFRRAHPDVCILAETFAFQQAVADFLMGTTPFMLALYDYPEALQAFMARLADWVIAIMRQAVRAGADIVFLQDDYGATGGPLISMAMWEAFTYPHLKRMVEAVHDAGALFMLHSCGHQMPFLPYYVEAGVDILQSFQPKADNDFALAYERYGDRLAFATGIDIQRGESMSPQELREEISRYHDQGRRHGRFILATTHMMQCTMPSENVRAIFETVREIQEGEQG